MQKILFSREDPFNLVSSKKILNFLNTESLWHYKNNSLYKNSLSSKDNFNFPDGRFIASKLKVMQRRGPTFTRSFLLSSLAKNKKHFFICNYSVEEISKVTKINKKYLFVYPLPFISGFSFSDKDRNKVIDKLKLFSPDYVWVGIGAPKQEILSNQLYLKYKCTYINIGAGIDFLLSKKSEAPKIFIKLRLEWFYRLLTDFKRSRKKVYRSIVGLRYLKYIKCI